MVTFALSSTSLDVYDVPPFAGILPTISPVGDLRETDILSDAELRLDRYIPLPSF